MLRSMLAAVSRGSILSTVLVGLILVGCVDDGGEHVLEDPGLVPGPGAGELDHTGGVLRSQDGRLALVVSAGALQDTLGITIDALAEPLDGIVGSAYRLEPTALRFMHPVSIEIRVDARALDVATINGLRVAVLDDLGQWVALAEPVVDLGTATVRASTETLGTFAVIAGGCSADTDCAEGLACAVDATCRRPTCQSDAACTELQLCVEGRCKDAQPCASPDECAPDHRCTLAGLCASRGVCSDTADCADDSVCEAGACVRAADCVANDDCGPEARCEAGVCVADSPSCPDERPCECASESDCQLGEVCVDGRCEGRRTCGESAECAAGRECIDGLCRAP